MSDANKNVVRRLFEEVWNKGNLPVADELFAENYSHHDSSTPEFGRGPASEKKRANLYRTAFPDVRFTVEDIIAEDETVTARWSCKGTHKGDLSGIAPTGKQSEKPKPQQNNRLHSTKKTGGPISQIGLFCSSFSY